jgi:hypothetical protein
MTDKTKRGDKKKPSSLRGRVDRARKTHERPVRPVPIVIGLAVIVVVGVVLALAFKKDGPAPSDGTTTQKPRPGAATAEPGTAGSAPAAKEPEDLTEIPAPQAAEEGAPEGEPPAGPVPATSSAVVTERKLADGVEYEIDAPSYKAVVGKSGMLTSMNVEGTEILDTGLDFPAGGEQSIQSGTALDTPVPGLELQLSSKAGPLGMEYAFYDDHVVAHMSHALQQWQNYRLSFNPETTLAFEDLQDRRTVSGETINYLDNGPRRAAPVERLSRIQMLRAIYPDFSVKVYHTGWGAPYNIDEIGSINGYTWGRNLMEGNRTMTIHWIVEPGEEKGRKAGPVFATDSGKFNNLFYIGEDVTWQLNVKQETVDRVPADADRVVASWEIRDFWNRDAGKGSKDFTPADLAGPLAVTLQPEGRGFFSVTFSLTVPGTTLVPSDYYTRFAVMERVAGIPERPEAGARLPGEYGNAALMGMKMVRMSHDMKGYFPDPNTEKWDDLGRIFTTSAAETKKWGIDYLFQANGRPGWAGPEQYEEVAYKMVSRYKDLCKYWEVENEPNFGYSPQDYISKCLIPFAKGAKRADPDCVVMGPACVSVPLSLVFLEEIYKQGANKYLDAVSTHTYMGPGESWEQFGNLHYLARVREIMQAGGDGGKTLWQTEQGFGWGSEPKQRQARYVTRQYLCGYMRGITNGRQYYFYPVHNGFEPWYLVESGSSAGMNGTWEPGAAAVRAMAEALDGTEFVRREPSPHEGTFVARFTGEDRDVFAMWTLDFPIDCRLSVGGAREIRDIMGNRTETTGSLKVTLSGEPRYLVAAKGANFAFLSPRFGKNVSSVAQGATYSASTSHPERPPANAGDGRWSMRDGAPNMQGQRTFWSPPKPLSPGGPPQWLEVKLPVARPVDRALIITCLPAVEANPRDYLLQVWADNGWKTVADVKGSQTWTIHHQFPAVETDRLRLVITKINDGWHFGRRWMHMVADDFKRYTDSVARICDVQLYGPPATVEVVASVEPETAFAPQPVKMTVEVTGTEADGFTGEVAASVPEGWTASPASSPVTLARSGDTKRIEFAVTPPARLAAGPVPLGASARRKDGKLADAAGALFEVRSPVRLEPRPLPGLDPTEQRVVLTVRNVSERPAKGSVGLSLTVDGKTLRANEPFDLKVAEAKDVTFVLRNVDLAGRPATAAYLATCDSGVDVEARQEFSVMPYSFIGPFSNVDRKGFDAVYAPENEIDLQKTYATEEGTSGWRTGTPAANGFFDFTGRFSKRDWVLAYAATFVHSSREQKASLSCGSDDGIKVWVNGDLVVANDTYRGAAPGQEEASISLRKGWNTILLKITQGGGGWGFYLSVLGPGGEPLQGIRFADGIPTEITGADGRKAFVPATAREFGGHFYAAVDNRATWAGAKEYCERRGGHLVTISSKEENDFVLALADGMEKQEAWIGLTDERKEGAWEWVTGEPGGYTSWSTGEPNNAGGSEDCALLTENGWNDLGADSWCGFICEWEPAATE